MQHKTSAPRPLWTGSRRKSQHLGSASRDNKYTNHACLATSLYAIEGSFVRRLTPRELALASIKEARHG